MELKEMVDTAVIINTVAEYNEYNNIRMCGGWDYWTLPFVVAAVSKKPQCFSAFSQRDWDEVSINSSWYTEKITLAQFKERNGIVKYSKGQVLVSGKCEFKILAASGAVYCMSQADRFDIVCGWYTEQELSGYTLKTDEPEKVEVSFKEAAAIVAEKKGVSVEELLIKD